MRAPYDSEKLDKFDCEELAGIKVVGVGKSMLRLESNVSKRSEFFKSLLLRVHL